MTESKNPKIHFKIPVEWRKIPDFPNYCVSNYGNVKSFRFNKNGKEMKASTNRTGYYRVSLHNGGKSSKYIHRLVAELFVPNPFGYEIVDHIDRNKSNNNAWNLRWVNSSDSVRNTDGSRTSSFWGVKFRHRKWIASVGIDRKVEYIGTYDTEIEAAKAYDQALITHGIKDRQPNFPDVGQEAFGPEETR